MTLAKKKCQERLALLWLTGSGFTLLLLVVATIGGRYGNNPRKPWEWFMPTVVPTLALIVAVLVYESQTQAAKNAKRIDGFIYGLSFWLSFAYLMLVAMTILLQPFSNEPLMELSHLFLAPLQGLVGASLGIFFVNRGETNKEAPRP